MATCMQIRLPLACLLIMLYCLALFLRKQRLPTKASRVFSWMGFVAVLNLCAATAMEYAVNNRALVPEGLNRSAISSFSSRSCRGAGFCSCTSSCSSNGREASASAF